MSPARRIWRHVRANTVAYIALFVALGGTSYAATQLPANSVGARQIKNHSITPIKLNPSDIGASVRFWAVINDRVGNGAGHSIAATSNTDLVGPDVRHRHSQLESTSPAELLPPRERCHRIRARGAASACAWPSGCAGRDIQRDRPACTRPRLYRRALSAAIEHAEADMRARYIRTGVVAVTALTLARARIDRASERMGDGLRRLGRPGSDSARPDQWDRRRCHLSRRRLARTATACPQEAWRYGQPRLLRHRGNQFTGKSTRLRE